MTKRKLKGLHVFLVEDESMVMMLIEDMLIEMGCKVIIASELDEAQDKASSLDFDIAVLDVNLNGSYSYPVAELLSEKRVPFIFSTGYGVAGIPEELRHVPIVGKPFREETLQAAMAAALERH